MVPTSREALSAAELAYVLPKLVADLNKEFAAFCYLKGIWKDRVSEDVLDAFLEFLNG